MNVSDLKELFRRALQATVIAPVALVGCGPDTTSYTAADCIDHQLQVRSLQPAVIPDVMALREVTNRMFEPMSKPRTMSTTGTACETATDKPVCQAAFDGLTPMSGFASACLQLCVDYHLATTKGDEVKAVDSLEKLKVFLGPIDTAQEALFIAFANGYSIQCGQADRGAAKAVGMGWEVIGTKGIACGPGTAVTRHFLSVTREGELTETRSEVIERGDPNCAIGRRPPGLTSRGASGCDEALGRFFAQAAHLEAASVPAFERLAVELAHHGAPAALCEAALSAALEELHHTRITAELARRFGATPQAPEVAARPVRSLFELALDNAVEGCVRETFGALVAQHQAQHAQDAGIRAALQDIAVDETRHAEFSWALDAWAMPRLSADEQLVVRRARVQALNSLAVELAAPVDPEVAKQAGLPTPAIAQRLLREVSAALAA